MGQALFLAWTTTPWTLAANSALCVGPNIDYVAVQTYNPYSGEPVTVVMAEVLYRHILIRKEAVQTWPLTRKATRLYLII